MGWSTSYSGPQMDASLEKGRDLKVVDNGWIKLDSSTDNPINLNNLKNPGNYSVFYWVNGPSLNDPVLPINISIVSINEKIYQFITAGGYTYSRSENNNKTSFTNWVIDQTSGALKPGVSAPASPVDGKTLWLDINTPSAPILKLYVNGEWKEIIPAGIMQASVYDKQGKRTDIFKYIEDALSVAMSGETGTGSQIDFDDHINDTNLHVTKADKNRWDSLPTTDNLTEKVNQLKSDIDSDVAAKISPNSSTFEELDQNIDLVKASYDLHIADTSSHPSIEKQNEWDNKADQDHQHMLDGRVVVSPDHVRGNIPYEKLPYDVKEKVYTVASEAELSTKTKNPIHNGDIFYIETPSGITWYFVVDDSYLGTASALTSAFKRLEVKQNVTWLNVTNKPNTIEGYGIVDAASESDIARVANKIESITEEIPNSAYIVAIADAQAKYNKTQVELDQLKTTVNLLDEVVALYSEIAQ